MFGNGNRENFSFHFGLSHGFARRLEYYVRWPFCSIAKPGWTMILEVVVDHIPSSTPQVCWIVFGWDVMPTDVLVLLDLVHSV